MGFNSLDMLTSNGIVAFDADSYVKGTGSQAPLNNFGMPQLPQYNSPLNNPYLQSSPNNTYNSINTDAFISSHNTEAHSIKRPSLNAIFTAAIIGLLGVGAGVKINSVKNRPKVEKKGFFTRIKDKFSKKPAEETTKKVVENESGKVVENTSKASPKPKAKAKSKTKTKTDEKWFTKILDKGKELFSKGKENFKSWPKPAQYISAGVAGLAGLYGIYRLTSKEDKRQYYR